MQDAGLFRKIPLQNKSWSIVCDGIGGQLGGAEAANICVSEYDKFLSTSLAKKMVANTIDFLKLGMLPVLDAFYNHVQHNQTHEHMGCTFALAYLGNDQAYFCWCGDSRIYLFRNGKIKFKSLPHNPSFDNYREGQISLRQAEAKKTNIITRSISVDTAFPILECKQMKLESGDRILVCTDGVWNKLNRNDLHIIASSANLNITVKLIEKKLGAVADDNYWGLVGEVK
jgi:serine/threonine protein phosphatase PrpC